MTHLELVAHVAQAEQLDEKDVRRVLDTAFEAIVEEVAKDDKVVVSGVNIATRHKKPSQTDPKGGLERIEAPLHVSNVAIADPKTGKATRVRFETRDGKKVRIAAKSGELING